jgi:hypothetical protein
MANAESELIESLPPETAELGPPERVHPALISIASPNGFSCLLTGLIILAFGALFIYSGLYAPMKNATPEGLVGGGVFFSVLGTWLVATALRYRPPSMAKGDARGGYVVFEDALAFNDGQRWRIVRWEDVEELTNRGGLGDYRLTTRQAFTVPIEHAVKHYDTLIARVFEEVTGHLVPRFLQAVEQGTTVHFGPFTVSRDALGYQGKSLSWSELGSFTIILNRQHGRRLRVRTKGALFEWCLVPIDSIPNTEVFLQVIQLLHQDRILNPTGPSS